MFAPIRFPMAALICLVPLGASAQDAASRDAAAQPKADLAPPPPSIDWYRPTDSDESVPWNGNAMGKPYDSWRSWRSIAIGFWSRAISFKETESEPTYSDPPTITAPAVDYDLSTVALVAESKPFGFFIGKASLSGSSPDMDMYTFGGTMGFPWTPLLLDMGLPDVQIGVLLPELFASAAFGSKTMGDEKLASVMFSLGARIAGLRVTVLDGLVAELRLGMVSLDAEDLTYSTPDPNPYAASDVEYTFTRDRFGFELAPEFRVGAVF